MPIRALAYALGLALAMPSVASAAWHKGFVVNSYSYLPGWAEGERDANCPSGLAGKADWAQLLHTSWRSEEDVRRMTANGGISFSTPLHDRGPKPGQNVHRDPTLVRDPRLPIVTGNIGYGFDLDHNPETGFVSPDGARRGGDNQLYRAIGCIELFRGGRLRGNSGYDHDGMLNGTYTILIVLSGEGSDPRNDPDVRVGFYLSKDPLTKDSRGEVARDFSYRIDPDPRFTTVFEARSENGVVTPKRPLERFRIREARTPPNWPQAIVLEQPQVRLTLESGDTVLAEIGGYRDWRMLYMGWASAGSPSELATGFETPALWYNWQRLADWKPPGVEGPNTHVSAFHALVGIPAFVITPDSNQLVTRAEAFEGQSLVARTPPEALAALMRAQGGDPGFRLVGGAAAWPREPERDAPVLPRGDPMFWARLLVDPAGMETAYKAAIGPELAAQRAGVSGAPGPQASTR